MKRTIILLIITVLTLITGGCKKKIENTGTFVYTDVKIVYKDNLGNNLLDSVTPNHYSIANMHVFYLENGVKKEYFNGKADAPKGLSIFKDATGQYVLDFNFCGPGVNNTVTNFLQLSDTDMDTLIGIFDTSNGNDELTKAWCNGVLWKSGASPNFTIVKK